ncbi:hypothetical protein D9M69_705370 [compost metagenome]
MPKLAQGDPVLKQAQLMQGQARAGLRSRPARYAFDRVVVGAERGNPAIDDPAPQALIAPIQHGAAAIEHRRVGRAAHGHDLVGEPRVQAQHVAGLDIAAGGIHGAHQQLIAHILAHVAAQRMQVQ